MARQIFPVGASLFGFYKSNAIIKLFHNNNHFKEINISTSTVLQSHMDTYYTKIVSVNTSTIINCNAISYGRTRSIGTRQF